LSPDAVTTSRRKLSSIEGSFAAAASLRSSFAIPFHGGNPALIRCTFKRENRAAASFAPNAFVRSVAYPTSDFAGTAPAVVNSRYAAARTSSSTGSLYARSAVRARSKHCPAIPVASSARNTRATSSQNDGMNAGTPRSSRFPISTNASRACPGFVRARIAALRNSRITSSANDAFFG